MCSLCTPRSPRGASFPGRAPLAPHLSLPGRCHHRPRLTARMLCIMLKRADVKGNAKQQLQIVCTNQAEADFEKTLTGMKAAWEEAANGEGGGEDREDGRERHGGSGGRIMKMESGRGRSWRREMDEQEGKVRPVGMSRRWRGDGGSDGGEIRRREEQEGEGRWRSRWRDERAEKEALEEDRISKRMRRSWNAAPHPHRPS
eukprot:2131374-Pyramimonas_sp.AAC.1